MNTGEFLSRLEDALRGKVSNQVIEANLQYYRDYITGEIRKGRTEEQVMDDLGDPRLIAQNYHRDTGRKRRRCRKRKFFRFRLFLLAAGGEILLPKREESAAGSSPGRYI